MKELPKLNDSCWLHILKFLSPLDWLNITKVCKHWKKLSSLLTIKNLSLIPLENNPKNFFQKGPGLLINNKQVMSILWLCGPKIQSLQLKSINNSKTLSLKLDHHEYRVHNFTLEDALEILCENAFNISEIEYKYFEYSKSRNKLLKGNKKLRKLILDDSKFEDIVEQLENPIEDLTLIDFEVENIESIEKYFSNLTRFRYTAYYKNNEIAANVLSKICQHAKKLKQLYLKIDFVNAGKTEPLSYLSQLTDLEEVYISGSEVTMSNTVALDIVNNCKKLKIVELYYTKMKSKKGLAYLLSLPDLEILRVGKVKQFPRISSVKISQLKKLAFSVENENADIDVLLNAILKMPKITNVEISGLDSTKTFDLTTKIIKATPLKNKIIVIQNDIDMEEEITIQYKTIGNLIQFCQVKQSVLTLCIGSQSYDFFKKIEDYVDTKLHNCKVVEKAAA